MQDHFISVPNHYSTSCQTVEAHNPLRLCEPYVPNYLWGDNIALKTFVSRKMGDMKYAGVKMFRIPGILFKDLEMIGDVLVKDFPSFHDNWFQMDEKKDPILSKNPFFAVGEQWKQLRTQISPQFTSGKVNSCVTSSFLQNSLWHSILLVLLRLLLNEQKLLTAGEENVPAHRGGVQEDVRLRRERTGFQVAGWRERERICGQVHFGRGGQLCFRTGRSLFRRREARVCGNGQKDIEHQRLGLHLDVHSVHGAWISKPFHQKVSS